MTAEQVGSEYSQTTLEWWTLEGYGFTLYRDRGGNGDVALAFPPSMARELYRILHERFGGESA